MSSWQVLRAGRASRAALGYRVHHGPGVLVHYSTTPAAARDSRSFCLSREKVALQDLNRRLASYLQQVQCLEAVNQKLERQIYEELDKKGPGELSELDTHLRTVSLLQHQIGECLSAQAQVKLQLLSAELTSLDLSARYEKEREHRGRLEAELSDLRLLGDELNVHKLPELQSLLNKHLQELMELQFQHQQDMQGCPTQVSGVAVKMQTIGSSDLIQQLEDLRECVTLLNKNQNECWLNTQVSVLACDSAVGSEVDQSKLEELRRTAASLEEERTQLQDLNAVLEASGVEQTESFVLQLEVLQLQADNLCRDLESVLQGTAQQAADYQALLYVKTRLQTEINDYKRLLDAMSQQRFSSLHSNSVTNFPSYYATTSPSSVMKNFTVHKTVSSQVGNQRMNQVRTVSRDNICTVKKTPEFGSLTEIATTGQTITDNSKHPKSLILRSINTSNQTGSFHKSQNKKTEALAEGTGRESMTTGAKINNQSIPVEDKINSEDLAPLNSGFDDCQIREDFQDRAVLKASKLEIHTSSSMLLSGKQSDTSPTDQPKLDILTSNQATTEAFKHITLQTEISKACDTDPSKQTAAEIKKETETVVSSPINCIEGAIQAEEKTELFTSEQNTTEAGLQANRTGSNIHNEIIETIPCAEPEYAFSSKENKDSGSGIALHCPDTNVDLQRRTESTDILNKVEVEVNEREVVKSSNDINKVEMNPAEIDDEINNPPSQEALMSTTKSKKSTSRTDSGVALSSSSTDEFLSPDEGHVFMSPSNPLSALGQEICLSPVETEVIMSMNAQVFCPVDLGSRSPDSLLSPEDPDMFLSPNDPNTCLSPVEANLCRSPNFEDEDEEACLSPSEANMRVRPVEKYVLTTKEEGRSLSFSGDQALPGEGRNSSISESDGDSLCFGSFEDNTESSFSVNSSKVNYKPTSQGIGSQSKGLEFSGPSGRSVIADKEEQLGFGGLYRRSTGNAPSPRDMDKSTGDTKDIKNILNHGSSLGGTDEQKEDPCIKSGIREQNNYNNNLGDFGIVPANERTTFIGVTYNLNDVATNSGMASDSASLCEMAANSLGKVSNNEDAAAELQGRFRKGSGDWKVYGTEKTSRSLSSTGSEEGPSGATLPATSRPETGRFSRRRSGDLMVYGSLGRKSSLSSTRKEEAMLFSTSQPDTTFGSMVSTTGELMVDSSSLKHTISQAGSDDLCNTERRESLPTAPHLATSPPETGRFGSRGSGEWKFYGGSTGRISSWASSSSLPNADDKKSSLADIQLATSPPAIPRAGRFDGGGSGEWKFYGGSTRRLSSASSADGVGVSANFRHIISPPTSGQRLSSAGSGGRLSSGSVVRRSSSVGSGGRLSSSSGSHRTSSSGRYASTGSGERKTSSQRAPSPGGRMSGSMGSGGWLNSSTAGGNHISSPVSRPKLNSAGSSDRISRQSGGRISSSSGSGRASSTGGRVISSSNWPIRSTGSGAGSNKERISVCKMAALSISAAGRERSQDRRSQAQKSHQQQQAAGTSPLLQRWLSTGVGVTSADPEGLNDVMHL
ncbi:uncharacterized protein LKV04_018659 [Tautogolabrus adspersus]